MLNVKVWLLNDNGDHPFCFAKRMIQLPTIFEGMSIQFESFVGKVVRVSCSPNDETVNATVEACEEHRSKITERVKIGQYYWEKNV